MRKIDKIMIKYCMVLGILFVIFCIYAAVDMGIKDFFQSYGKDLLVIIVTVAAMILLGKVVSRKKIN
jgi:hypothetical protein